MNTVLPREDTTFCAVFEEAMILKKLFALLNSINNVSLPLKFNAHNIEGYAISDSGSTVRKRKHIFSTIMGHFVLYDIELPWYTKSDNTTTSTCILHSDQISRALNSVKKRNYLSLYEKPNDPHFYYNLNGIPSTISPVVGSHISEFTPPKFEREESDPNGRMPVTMFNEYCSQCKNYGKDTSGALKISVYEHGLVFRALSYGENRNSERSCGQIDEKKYIDTMYININSILLFVNTITVIAPIGSVVKFYINKSDYKLGYLKVLFKIGGFGLCRIYIEGIQYDEN